MAMLRDQMSCQRDAGPHLQGAVGWNLVHVSVGECFCSCSIINSRIKDSGSMSLFSYLAIMGCATTKPTNSIICSSSLFLIHSLFRFPCKQSSLFSFPTHKILQSSQWPHVPRYDAVGSLLPPPPPGVSCERPNAKVNLFLTYIQ